MNFMYSGFRRDRVTWDNTMFSNAWHGSIPLKYWYGLDQCKSWLCQDLHCWWTCHVRCVPQKHVKSRSLHCYCHTNLRAWPCSSATNSRMGRRGMTPQRQVQYRPVYTLDICFLIRFALISRMVQMSSKSLKSWKSWKRQTPVHCRWVWV